MLHYDHRLGSIRKNNKSIKNEFIYTTTGLGPKVIFSSYYIYFVPTTRGFLF